jgi:ubiquitin C-terminal hydrolase
MKNKNYSVFSFSLLLLASNLQAADVSIVPNIGLVNQGNTCYQNAILQAIHKCTPLRDLLIAQLTASASQDQLVTELRNTLVSLQSTVGVAYDPHLFANKVCLALYYGDIGQQDAGDFLTTLLARLQKEAVIPDSTPVPGKILDESFGRWHGVSTSRRLTCDQCKGGRLSPSLPEYTCMLSLSLPAVGPSGSYTLPDLLTHFGVQEVLEGDNAVMCQVCAAKKKHIGQLEFTISPDLSFMVLQPKRFKFDMSTMAMSKITTPLIFDESGVVEIADSSGELSRFTIISVVVHEGDVSSGHYWTVSRDGVYNDSTVTLDAGAAMKTLLTTGRHNVGEVYLYFLQRLRE